ncbi:MAG: hypothetical protein ACYSSP_14410 [Planctomycetota bacterium]|jgi:hypothetical protein
MENCLNVSVSKVDGCNKMTFVLVVMVLMWFCSGASADKDIDVEMLASMPIKEVTIFKDGHAFVLHEGSVKTTDNGNVILDYFPRPIIGTFWAYSNDPRAELSAVVSERQIISVKKTALNIRQMIEGNIGAKVQITEDGPRKTYEATILHVPKRSTEEIRRTSAPGIGEMLPEQGGIVLLKVAEGVKAVDINRIREVVFLSEPESEISSEEYRNIMTLKLDWKAGKSSETADIGMVYLQRGIRWIPSYHIEIDGEGNALVKLQATLVNELYDLEDVTTNLVIGVPSFAFKDVVDSISLQQTVAQLSSHFEQSSRSAYAFSNAIMTQRGLERPVGSNMPGPVDLGPEVAGSLTNEDLYIFTVEHVTLKKGQRMVFPITEFKLKYKDVFVLDLPFAPPPEVRHRLNSEQQTQLARLFHAPKAIHKIRFTNDTKHPITTAPALILRDGRIIAQGMMTYTSVGAESDLELTTAVDISVDIVDRETERIPDAEQWHGSTYSRNNLAGEISLSNNKKTKVYLEVKRSVLGNIDSVSDDGEIEHLGWHEGWLAAEGFPYWWNWHSWPYWWYHFNPAGQVTWELELEPSEKIDLEYTWHYFWRW